MAQGYPYVSKLFRVHPTSPSPSEREHPREKKVLRDTRDTLYAGVFPRKKSKTGVKFLELVAVQVSHNVKTPP